MNKKKIIIIVILSFACGLLAGGIGSKFYFRYLRTRGFQQIIFQKIDRELNLDINQKIATKRTLEQMDNNLKQLKKEYCPKKQKIFKQGFSKIRNSLLLKQKTKFDKLTNKISKRTNSCHLN